jgi:hypothetical protein
MLNLEKLNEAYCRGRKPKKPAEGILAKLNQMRKGMQPLGSITFLDTFTWR